jgi:hypothetical protein
MQSSAIWSGSLQIAPERLSRRLISLQIAQHSVHPDVFDTPAGEQFTFGTKLRLLYGNPRSYSDRIATGGW